MSLIKVIGLSAVTKAITGKQKEIEKGAVRGLIKAGLIIERDAKKNAPVDTGNLKASGFTLWRKSDVTVGPFEGRDASKVADDTGDLVSRLRAVLKKNQVAVGFGANYGLYVHELHAEKKRFLLKAIKKNKARILKVMSKEIQKG